MTLHPKLFRLISVMVALSLVLAPAVSFAGVSPSLSRQAGDPPGRVGRLAQITGTVSFHTADEDHWDPATLNYPVTSGNAFWTEPGGRAEIEVSGTQLVMNEQTELDLDSLNENSLVATEPQGEVYLRIRHLDDGESYVLQTPRGVVTIRTPGRYAVIAGDTQHPTSVTVLEGTAEIAADNRSQQVGADQTALITGTENFQAQIEPAQPDAFVTALLDAERPPSMPGSASPPAPRQAAVAPPAVVAEMSGGDDLDSYGAWQTSPQYGTVWYPQVASGWVPYREGHWAYVEPWGWTWVDNAPWGFAPFHYGRWVAIDGRWAWVPAEYAVAEAPAPIYAPALVSFFDPGAAFAAGVAVGAVGALAVGWLPLGPREVYRPWYRASPGYLRGMNVRQVRNVTNITNARITNVTVNNYVNRVAATGMPAAAMATSRPVAGVARPIPVAQLGQVRPIVGRVPVAPTTATAGVSSVVAGRLHLKPPPAGVQVPARPAAPGPAIAASTFRPGAARNPAIRGAAVNGTAPVPAMVPPIPRIGPANRLPTTATGRPQLPPLAAPGARAAIVSPGTAPGPAIAPHPPGSVRNPAQRPGQPPAIGDGHGPVPATAHPAAPASPRGPVEPHPGPPPQANVRPAAPLEIHPPEGAGLPQRPAVPTPPPAMHQAAPVPAFHPPPAAEIRPVPPPQAAVRPPPVPSFHPPTVAAPAPVRPPPSFSPPPPQAQIVRPAPPSFHPPAPAAAPVMRAPPPRPAPPPNRQEERRPQP